MKNKNKILIFYELYEFSEFSEFSEFYDFLNESVFKMNSNINKNKNILCKIIKA